MDALQARHVDEPRRVSREQASRHDEARRERPEAALGDALRAPADALAALEQPGHERVELEALQQVVHRERGVGGVEPDDQAEAELVVAHRVDERAADLVMLRARAKRPAERVDDPVQPLRHLPDLLDPEGVDLGVLGGELEAVAGGVGEQALDAVAQHRGLGRDLGAGLEVRELLALTPTALVAGAHAAQHAVLHQQALGVGLGEQHDPELLGLLGQRPHEPGQREDVVALVVERRRGGEAQRPRGGEEVDALAAHLAVRAELVERDVRQQVAQRARLDDGARDLVGAERAALLEHHDGHLAELLGGRRVALQVLGQADRAGEPRRAAADERRADLDLVLGVRLGLGDELGRVVGRGELGGGVRHRRSLLIR